MAKLVIQKVSNRGVRHPVVARLSVQMSELINFSGAEKSVREEILKACIGDLQSRLGKCWDIWQRLETEQARCDANHMPSDNPIAEIPHITDLDRDVDNFLYEAKNFLRDLMNQVVRKFFPDIKYSDASAFFESRAEQNKPGPFTSWAEEKFGAQDGFVKMLREDQVWIEELVRKRNAIEHPGGHSGSLTVQNIKAIPNGGIMAPVWQRTGSEARFISTEMAEYCHYLLNFAEEVIIFGCILKTCSFPMVTFAEIPEEERNPECPIRFRAVMLEGSLGK